MNIWNFLLLNTTQLRINKVVLILIQVVLLILLTGLIYRFAFHHDWKRFIILICLILIGKLTLDLSITIYQFISRTSFSPIQITYKEFKNPIEIKASWYIGLILILLFTIQFLSYNAFINHVDQLLFKNGVKTIGYAAEVYWHKSKRQRNTGYKLEYFYVVNNEKYHHRILLGDSPEFSTISVTYLPALPDRHEVEIK